MTSHIQGRFTARIPQDGTALFLIGMRINRPWKVRSWAPVAGAMPKMLRHLAADPESGLLSFHNWFGRTTILVSYWRDPDDIRRFASDTDAPHLQAWRDFTRKVAPTGDVGVWHETYVLSAGNYEGVYSNMPEFGLAKATEHVPVGPGGQTWKQRLGRGAPVAAVPD